MSRQALGIAAETPRQALPEALIEVLPEELPEALIEALPETLIEEQADWPSEVSQVQAQQAAKAKREAQELSAQGGKPLQQAISKQPASKQVRSPASKCKPASKSKPTSKLKPEVLSYL